MATKQCGCGRPQTHRGRCAFRRQQGKDKVRNTTNAVQTLYKRYTSETLYGPMLEHLRAQREKIDSAIQAMEALAGE